MGGTKVLLGLVVGMGALIMACLALVVATLAHRMIAPPQAQPTSSARVATSTLGEPAGTRVGGLAAFGDRVALLLQGGGVADRIVLLDGRDGTLVGTIAISGPAARPVTR